MPTTNTPQDPPADHLKLPRARVDLPDPNLATAVFGDIHISHGGRLPRALEELQSASREARSAGFVVVLGDLYTKLSPAGTQLTVQPAAEPHDQSSTKP